MRLRVIIALKAFIPLFAKKPSHSFVPLDRKTAGARSEGQGRPKAGALRAPLTVASTLAGWRRGWDRSVWRYTVLLLTGMLAFITGSASAIAQSAPGVRSAAAHSYAPHIAEASQRFGIPEHWIRAVLRAESAGKARAVSSAGAMGLMQVMPDTWAGLRVRHRLGRDAYDPRDNILAGTAYMREMWDRYGNVAAMLAAYNAGPGRYDEHRATGRPLPAETRAYVAALLPLLSGVARSDTPVKRSERTPDWRDAPLFVLRASNTRPAAGLSPRAQSGNARAIIPTPNPVDKNPLRGDMFVSRANDGGTP